MRRTSTLLLVLGLSLWCAAPLATAVQGLRGEIESLNQAMLAAFKSTPASVAVFYTDDAAVIGAGQRHQGRAAIDAYWASNTMFKAWTIEVLEHGGPNDAPWQYGRSVVTGQSGRSMETYFIGLLLRQASGQLRFRADVFVRDRSTGRTEDAERVTAAWLNAVERGDATALNDLFDSQFIILSPSGARDKAQEIADLVPTAGVALPYFRSRDTQTRAFGSIAITTGVLEWEFNGRRNARNYASIAADRGAGWKIVAQQITPHK